MAVTFYLTLTVTMLTLDAAPLRTSPSDDYEGGFVLLQQHKLEVVARIREFQRMNGAEALVDWDFTYSLENAAGHVATCRMVLDPNTSDSSHKPDPFPEKVASTQFKLPTLLSSNAPNYRWMSSVAPLAGFVADDAFFAAVASSVGGDKMRLQIREIFSAWERDEEAAAQLLVAEKIGCSIIPNCRKTGIEHILLVCLASPSAFEEHSMKKKIPTTMTTTTATTTSTNFDEDQKSDEALTFEFIIHVVDEILDELVDIPTPLEASPIDVAPSATGSEYAFTRTIDQSQSTGHQSLSAIVLHPAVILLHPIARKQSPVTERAASFLTTRSSESPDWSSSFVGSTDRMADVTMTPNPITIKQPVYSEQPALSFTQESISQTSDSINNQSLIKLTTEQISSLAEKPTELISSIDYTTRERIEPSGPTTATSMTTSRTLKIPDDSVIKSATKGPLISSTPLTPSPSKSSLTIKDAEALPTTSTPTKSEINSPLFVTLPSNSIQLIKDLSTSSHEIPLIFATSTNQLLTSATELTQPASEATKRINLATPTEESLAVDYPLLINSTIEQPTPTEPKLMSALPRETFTPSQSTLTPYATITSPTLTDTFVTDLNRTDFKVTPPNSINVGTGIHGEILNETVFPVSEEDYSGDGETWTASKSFVSLTRNATELPIIENKRLEEVDEESSSTLEGIYVIVEDKTKKTRNKTNIANKKIKKDDSSKMKTLTIHDQKSKNVSAQIGLRETDLKTKHKNNTEKVIVYDDFDFAKEYSKTRKTNFLKEILDSVFLAPFRIVDELRNKAREFIDSS